MVYILPNHHVPYELDDCDVAQLPTHSRTVKAELSTVVSITFEGHMGYDGRITTRREITDLLADLADTGVKPLLRVVLMPHRPHHEDFKPLENGYETETYE